MVDRNSSPDDRRGGVGAATRRRLPDEQQDRSTAERTRAEQREEVTFSLVALSGAVEVLGGMVAGALALAALVGAMPVALAGVSALILGGVLLVEGAALGSRYGNLASLLRRRYETARVQLSGGIAVEVVAGAAGCCLAILAVLGVAPAAVLLPIALIAYGVALVLSTPAAYRLATVAAVPRRFSDPNLRRTRVILAALAGTQLLVGIALLAMATTTLASPDPEVELVLAALLTLSAAFVVGGTVVAALYAQLLTRLRTTGPGA